MPEVTIRIPSPLRSFSEGKDAVEVQASTVGEALNALGERHEGIRERVLDDTGDLRPFVNVYLGADDVRTLDGLATAVTAGAVLSIIPAVAGGVR